MNLSKNSWHYKLHCIVYGKFAKDPTNLCPYFWKTIVFGSIFFLIFAPICFPFWLTGIIAHKVFNEDGIHTSIVEEGLFSFIPLAGIIYNSFLFLAYSMVAMWFNFSWRSEITPFGVIGWTSVIILLIRQGWLIWKNKRRKHREPEKYVEPQPNVFVEYVKAWYKKHCPVIKWK